MSKILTAKTWEVFQVKKIDTVNGEASILRPTKGTQIVILPEDADLTKLEAVAVALGGKVVNQTKGPLFINSIEQNVSVGLDKGSLTKEQADRLLANSQKYNTSHSIRATLA